MLGQLFRLALTLLRANDDPQCACCVRGIFPGHVCPASVIEAREARKLIAAIREIR